MRRFAVALALLLALGPARAQLWLLSPASQSSARAVAPSFPPTIGGVDPAIYADTTTEGTTNQYFYSGATYGSFAALLAAAGGTFSRSSAAYYTNASGVLTSAASGVVRFDFDPLTLLPRGVLLEGSGKNHLEYSNLTASPWNAFSTMTVTANATPAPDGTSTASLLTMANSGSAEYQIVQMPGAGIPSGINTVSFYLEAGTARYINLQVYAGSASANSAAVFDLGAANTAATQTYSTAGVTVVSTSQSPAAEGFYRVSITFNSTITDASGFVGLNPCAAATGNAFGSDGGITANVANLTFYAWGAQYETSLAFASSLIPTTSSVATRGADNLSLPWTATTFTAMVKAILAGEADGNDLVDAGSGLISQASGPAVSSNNGTNSISTSAGAFTASNKIVVGGSASGRVLSANGNAAASDSHALVPSAPTVFQVGGSTSDAANSDGDYARFALWPVAATAAQAAQQSTQP